MSNSIESPAADANPADGEAEGRPLDEGIPAASDGSSRRHHRIFLVMLACILLVCFFLLMGAITTEQTPDEVAQAATGLSSQVDEPFTPPFVGELKLPKEATSTPLPPAVAVASMPSPRLSRQPAQQPLSKAEQEQQVKEAQLWEKRRRASSVVFTENLAAKPETASVATARADRTAMMQQMLSQVNAPATLPNTLPGSSPLRSGRGRASNDRNALAGRLQPSSTVTVEANLLKNPESTLTQGTLIACTLETAINSTLPGMTRCVVSEDVYSFDGSYQLVSKGSQLTGQYEGGIQQGEARVFVIWQRLLTPSGISVALDSPGTDTLGRSGQSAVVDSKFFKRFGASALLSIIGGVAATEGDNEVVLRATADSFNRSAEIALNNSINIPPEARINQGQRIKIFVARDVDFRSVLMLAREGNP